MSTFYKGAAIEHLALGDFDGGLQVFESLPTHEELMPSWRDNEVGAHGLGFAIHEQRGVVWVDDNSKGCRWARCRFRDDFRLSWGADSTPNEEKEECNARKGAHCEASIVWLDRREQHGKERVCDSLRCP